MPPNPFIELARDPIATFAWLGYGLLLLAIVLAVLAVVVVAVPWSIRQTAKLVAHYYRDRRSDDWWSFGDTPVGYLPPGSWLAGAFKVVAVYIALAFLMGIASWAVGGLIWLVGGG